MNRRCMVFFLRKLSMGHVVETRGVHRNQDLEECNKSMRERVQARVSLCSSVSGGVVVGLLFN